MWNMINPIQRGRCWRHISSLLTMPALQELLIPLKLNWLGSWIIGSWYAPFAADRTHTHTIQPVLCTMYFLNYVDRNTIAQARLNDLEDDLGMSGVEFNTAVSILFVGYVLMQIPSNMMITRIQPAYYMSAWMVIWAVVSGCTAAVQNYAGLVACRFFLGITESPV